MCPPAPDTPAGLVLNGSDDQVILYLDGRRPGSPLPKNVSEDVNPYQFKPSNLPDGIWYLIQLSDKKENEFGLWEVKEEACEVFMNSSIIGWRTTLEFFPFQDSLEQKTNWVMQEYKITQSELCDTNKEKESRAICRVFPSVTRSSNTEMHPKTKDPLIVGRNNIQRVTSGAPSTDNTSKQDSTTESLVKNGVDGTKKLSEAGRLLDRQIKDFPELHYMSDGDYLELDDLGDPQSRSSSSDNSSRTSMASDEYFDPIALLKDLEDSNSQGERGNDSCSKFSVTASIRPFEVVMQPATSGSLVSATGRELHSGCTPASSAIKTEILDQRKPDHSVKRLKTEQRDEGPSSSNPGIPTSNKEKKADVVKTKRLKKYLCFMPF